MTLAEIKANNDSVIRQKTLPNTITTDNVADLLDDLADFSTTISGSAPSGSEGSVQYNASGAFAGNSNFKYIADQGIVFDHPFTTPALTNNHYYDFIVAKPIDTAAMQSDFIMTRWSYDNTAGVDPVGIPRNEGLMMGFNLNSGGGIRDAGKPSLGESWENNYLPDWDPTHRYVEKHEYYIPYKTAGGWNEAQQVRLSSWTINGNTNDISYYQRSGRFWIYGVPNSDVQTFFAQAGNVAIKDGADLMTFGVALTPNVDYGGNNDVATIYGYGTDILVFQGFPRIIFGGVLENANLGAGTVFPASIGLTNDLTIGGNFTINTAGRSTYMQIQSGNDAVAWYGQLSGLNRLWLYNFSDIKLYNATDFYIKSGLRIYTNSTTSYVMGQSDLSTVIGWASNLRVGNVFSKQYLTNSGAANPTTSDIDDGSNTLYKNTTTGVTKLWYNDGGVMGSIGGAAGSNTQVQTNDNGVLGASADFVWTGNILNVGNSTSTATATPVLINSGGTFGNNTAGTYGNLKWRLYDDVATVTNSYGIGMSGGIMEYQVPNSAVHVFYVNATEILKITAGGVYVTGTLGGSTTPPFLSIGASYGTNTAGNSGNLKLRVYDNGIDSFGMGISNGTMEYQVPSGSVHTFYVNAVEILKINSTDVLVTGNAKVSAPANTTTSVVTIDATQTLTNKRVNPRVASITSNATWSPSADNDDMYIITAQGVDATTISNPSGTPVNGQELKIRVKDDATARALTWSGSQWRASSDLALPTTTIVSKTLYMNFIWNSTDSKWDMLSLLNNF